MSNENENGIIKKFKPSIYKLKQYLEDFCRGKDNRQTSTEIMNGMLLEHHIQYNWLQFKKDVQTIRQSSLTLNCFIQGDKTGYWLPSNPEEVTKSYIKRVCTEIKTAIGNGADPKIFYSLLNDLAPNTAVDGQLKLKLTKGMTEDVDMYGNSERKSV